MCFPDSYVLEIVPAEALDFSFVTTDAGLVFEDFMSSSCWSLAGRTIDDEFVLDSTVCFF